MRSCTASHFTCAARMRLTSGFADRFGIMFG
jgi:hypothetical protein